MRNEIILSLSNPGLTAEIPDPTGSYASIEANAPIELVGGKGASLVRLIAAGMPVPGGFCITTNAYRGFVGQNNLQNGVIQALADRDLAVPAVAEAAARQIQASFLSAPLPEEMAGEIRKAYAQLGDSPAVAVRSSATAEDLPEASFAGQQDTFLNIRGPEAVLDAVRRCFASLWTARAIAYRARQGIAPDQVALAVVVQELVGAESAGILFPVDPLSGQTERMLVNSAWGLGEAVVGGLVTPDTFTIEKGSRRVIESQLAEKRIQTTRVDGGTCEAPVPEELRSLPSLTGEALAELARLGIQIEALYGMAMDIEWAAAGGKVYLLQARPVTALKTPPPLEWRVPDPKGHWMRGSFIDFMPDPLSTLFESMLLPTYAAAMPKIMDFFGMGDVDM
ncbi:MAG: PEP/pyruvate-binding domain-containing protein, partial [Anaerolineaceae bacterium]|nr:PEP/pyruvate-binding domain-containing protein [Anaerolineaceae bacterium]